jgi:hypothetical protein
MNFKLLILVCALIATQSAEPLKIECIGPNGSQPRGIPILLTCKTRLHERGPINLEFNVPENMKNHTYIGQMQNTSRVLSLSLPLTIDYQRKISCKMNNLRSETCYFSVDFEKNHHDLNIRRSDINKTQNENTDYGLLVFFAIFMFFIIGWAFYFLISIK